MRRIVDHDLLTLACRLLVGISFLYASFYKIIEPAAFAKSIWYYHMVPGGLINLMALILPWVELLCGLGLILGVYYRGSVLLTTVMTLIFIAALASAIGHGLNIDCGCFKAAEASSGSAWRALWYDLFLIAACGLLLASRSRRWMCRARA